MPRNPHPARRSRIATLGVSVTAFVSVVTSLAWNTNQAELAANTVDLTAVPVETTTPAATNATPVTSSATSNTVTPAATIAPTAPAAPANSAPPQIERPGAQSPAASSHRSVHTPDQH